MTAYGDDSALHFIRDGAFVCTAPLEAPCRTYPTCDCETWNCSDPADFEPGEHACMATQRPGQECWMSPWINDGAVLGDSYGDDEHYGCPTEWFPDGPVTVEWDDGCSWTYADATTPRDPEVVAPAPPALESCCPTCSGCESCRPGRYADLFALVDQTRDSP